MHAHVFAAVLSAALLASTATAGAAQSVWTHRPADRSVELEILRPNFANDADVFDGTTGAGFLTFRTPLAGRWSFVGDLPFTRAGFDGTELESANEIGNPYVGVEWKRSQRFTAELGVRIPTGDAIGEDDDILEELAVMGVGMAGEVERMEAFIPATLGVYAIGNWTLPVEERLTVRLRGGPSFLGGDGMSEDVHLNYTGQLWYGKATWNLGAGLAGRWAVTSDDGFSEDTVHQLVVAGDYGIGRLRPGVQVRLPLDDEISDVAGSTVAFSVGVALR